MCKTPLKVIEIAFTRKWKSSVKKHTLQELQEFFSKQSIPNCSQNYAFDHIEVVDKKIFLETNLFWKICIKKLLVQSVQF